MSGLVFLSSDGHEHLTDVDTSDESVGFTEGTTHTGLESISTSARKHLVDSEHVVWVDSDSQVEVLTSAEFSHVLKQRNNVTCYMNIS